MLLRRPGISTLATLLSFALAACGGASSSGPDVSDAGGSGGGDSQAADGGGSDASGTPDSPQPGPDGSQPNPTDGPPTRVQCTGQFGNALSTTHGRLDGFLVAIVPPGSGGCNGDADHVHLQVKMSGSVYDVAVTINSNQSGNVLFATKDAPLPDGAWAEGWHTSDNLDYPSNLGLHSADFTATPAAALAQKVSDELANANHVSVFMTGYGPTGGHKVHRNFGGTDGAVVVNPLSPTAHLLVFHFSTQNF